MPAPAMWCSAQCRLCRPHRPFGAGRQQRLRAQRPERPATSGYSVASAGDVNGDGFADVIVGALRDPQRQRSGASYVVFGKAAGFADHIDLSALDGSDGFALNGVAAAGLQRLLGRLGRRRQRRRLRRPDRRRTRRRSPTAAIPARPMWCSARPPALPTISTFQPRRHDGFRSTVWRPMTTAAFRSPRPATSTATASPT